MILHYRMNHIIRSFEKNGDEFTHTDKAYTGPDGKMPSINAAKRASRAHGLFKVRLVNKLPMQPCF